MAALRGLAEAERLGDSHGVLGLPQREWMRPAVHSHNRSHSSKQYLGKLTPLSVYYGSDGREQASLCVGQHLSISEWR